MSLIPEDNIWLVLVVVILMAAFSIFAEQKWKWAATLTGVTIAIFGSMLLVNLKIVPAKSPVYSIVSSYLLPLCIPMLLFKCDLKRIIKESGRAFLVVNVAILGSMISALICGIVLRDTEFIRGIMAMQVGAYVGGTVNMIAMGKVYNMDATYINAAAVVANAFVAVQFIIFNFLVRAKFLRRNFNHPHITAHESQAENGKTMQSSYWVPKPISYLNLVMAIATAMTIAGVSAWLSSLVNASGMHENVKMILGNIYLLICFITIALVTIFPKYFEGLNGAEELGNFLIMLFFVSIGMAADIKLFVTVGPIMIVTAIIMILANFLLPLIIGKFAKWNLEEVFLASCCTIGGPPTGAAFAIAHGWPALVVPAILIGLWGYAIGNIAGVFIAQLIPIP
jgi:uncharacterized membrane protein